jgi:hypothetical protein
MRPGGGEISGVVRDALGGGPIAHAVVARGAAAVETDDEGRYSLWLERANDAVDATADGYGMARAYADVPAQLDFALLPEATVSGIVVDNSSGRPLPHVRVQAAINSGFAQRVAISDDAGAFTFDKVAPAIYQFQVDDSHAYGDLARSVSVGLGQHLEGVVVTATPALEVSGRIVVEPTGDDCPAHGVLLVNGARGETDASGIVRVPASAGTFHVNIYCDHYLADAHYDDVVVTDRDVTDQIWTVTRGASITGRVVDTKGAPVVDARVYADSVTIDADPDHATSDSTTTGSDGS